MLKIETEENFKSIFEKGLEKLSEFSFCPAKILCRESHEVKPLSGCLGLATWTVQAEDESLWDVDWRYAFGPEIFKQHLIDFGWNEDKILYRHKFIKSKRKKMIFYVCSPELEIPQTYSGIKDLNHCEDEKLSNKLILHSIPESYFFGKYWQTINRGFMPLAEFPAELQGLLPETLPKALKLPYGDFATTRTLHDTHPEIVNHPEDEVQTIPALPQNSERRGEGGLRTLGLYKHAGPDKDPLISIITVVLNNASKLEQTLQSVINQSSYQVEYIVIDGGSTDGTLEIIKKYEDQIDYWVSEPDKGIYHAMNKGLTVASGDWVVFMNSGDCMNEMPGTLKGDVVYGAATIKYPDKTKKTIPRKLHTIKKDIIASHQSMYFYKSFYRRFKYSEELKYASDYELILKIYNNKGIFTRSNNNLSIISSGGVADENRIAVNLEYITIMRQFNYKTITRFFMLGKAVITIIIKSAVIFIKHSK